MVHTPRTSPAPLELIKHGSRWTRRFQAILNGSQKGDWATLNAKRVLRTALRDLAYGKCVYCEGALDAQVYLQVDHYVPKVLAPDLAFEWTNLLPVCQICNSTKGNQDHRNILLKPDDEDPEPYFWLHPDTGRLEPHPRLDDIQAHRAVETIRLCDLQRPALCTKRVEMMTRVLDWLAHADRSDSEWERLSNPRQEYKFVLRHVLETREQRVLAESDRSRFRKTI